MKKFALLSILFLLWACGDEYGSTGAKFLQDKETSLRVVNEGRIPYFSWDYADSIVCYQLDDSLEIKKEIPCSKEWGHSTLLDSAQDFRYAKVIVGLKSRFNDSLPEVNHYFNVMVDMKTLANPTLNQFAYLIQPRIKTLMLEGYSMEAAAYIASNELSDVFFLGKEKFRYDTDCNYECGADTPFFNLIFQGDFRNNLLKTEAFRQDFADGTVNDTTYLIDCAESMLTREKQSSSTLKFIDHHLGLDACDTTGKKVFVTNKASSYFGDSLYCTSRGIKHFYDKYEQKLGPCIDLNKLVCDTSSAICHRCTQNSWEETSKSTAINSLAQVCDSSSMDSSIIFRDTIYQCTRRYNGIISPSNAYYEWSSRGTDSLSFWFGNCTWSNSCELREHGGKKYSCIHSEWQVATESSEFCSLDYSGTVNANLYKTTEKDSIYYTCNYSECQLKEIAKEKADEYKIIEMFADSIPCTSSIVGKSAYQPTRLQYYVCEKSDDNQYRWRAYGKPSNYNYDTDIFIDTF